MEIGGSGLSRGTVVSGVVLLLSIVTAGCANVSTGTTPAASAPATPPPTCMVTGLGTKLCGAEAVAYCQLHVNADYIHDPSTDTPAGQDIESIKACTSVGYQPTAQDEHDACQQFGGQDPLPKPNPLPQDLRGDC